MAVQRTLAGVLSLAWIPASAVGGEGYVNESYGGINNKKLSSEVVGVWLSRRTDCINDVQGRKEENRRSLHAGGLGTSRVTLEFRRFALRGLENLRFLDFRCKNVRFTEYRGSPNGVCLGDGQSEVRLPYPIPLRLRLIVKSGEIE